MASAQATRELLRQAVAAGKVHPTHVRRVGRFTCSSIGFGAYRIGSSRCFEALEAAVDSGAVNLLETSTHYGQKYPGESEEMIGACLRARGEAKRKECVVVTKVGHITVPAEVVENYGIAADEYEKSLRYKNVVRQKSAGGAGQRKSAVDDTSRTQNQLKPATETSSEPLPSTTSGGSTPEEKNGSSGDLTGMEKRRANDVKPLERTWHCLEPDFLLEEFDASCSRLQTTPDFVFLHNPEFYLSDALNRGEPLQAAWAELYKRLEVAFATLEALRKSKRITGYGVSGNFLSCYHSVTGRKNAFEALSLQSVLGCAIDALARRGDARSAAGGADTSAGHSAAAEMNAEDQRLFQGTGFVGIQAPLNPLEPGIRLGRPNVVPGFDGEPDLAVIERNNLCCLVNRPLSAIAPPGMTIRAHDWAHADSSAEFVEKQMPMQRLFAQIFREQLTGENKTVQALKLQQQALLVAASSSNNGVVLNGMRKSQYVQQALEVLRVPCLSHKTATALYRRMQELALELGGDASGLWT
ncbi:unnamed protein product [Amoebophrya sp. A120]|nr:unnamed protein product [Amoebophrya sp. A120]|eukprot:GSA120T00018474001.1